MDNADLEKLKVSTGRLVPRFKPSVSGYSLTLNSDAEEVKLTPLTSDGGASYIIKASDSLAPYGRSTSTLQTRR